MEGGTPGPNSYLLHELNRAEDRAFRAEEQLADQKAALQACTAELKASKKKLSLMHRDLQVG